ncbi:MAG TPA: NPCBM/NEW2 domain-containing protein [Terriglobales bacterium]|nr:NPCBM/NEW2 domain-containing protein [Terriglobales bacterium]
MNRRSFLSSTAISALAAMTSKTLLAENRQEPKVVRLSSLHPRLANQGWGSLQFDKSPDGKPLQIGGRTFHHGVSTHARSDLVYLIGGGYTKLRAWVGVDAASSKSREETARFQVYGDGIEIFDSNMMRVETPAARVDCDVTNVNVLRLVVSYAGAYAEHADWAEAELVANPRHSAVRPIRAKKPLRQIRSGDLVFTAGGSSLAGLQLTNGKRIGLEGSFGIGPYAQPDPDASLTVDADFHPAPGGVVWEWQCSSRSHRPWVAPVDTVFKWPNSRAKVFLAWGHGSKWQDPLAARSFEDKTYEYGAFFNREGGLSLPMASILDEENRVGVTFIQSPNDVLLDMQISTSKSGEICFSRAFHRFGGEQSEIKFHMDIVVHEPDVRAALRAVVELYPQFFDPPCQLAHEVGGSGAYSGWEGAIDAKKLASMGFTVNWKASLDFPYMGMFLPPLKDDEKWNRFAGGGEGVYEAKDEGRYGQTSIHQIAEYSVNMRAQGFHVLNYFNVTEFGAHISYPAAPPKAADDPELWKNGNDFLHGRLENAVLKTPDPIWTWGKGVIMDCGDAGYRDFLIDQAKRHVEKFPASSGIAIDRMDWLTRYNSNADDGVTWIDGPCRHLRRSWIGLMEKMAPVFHAANKAIFANDMDRRLELMRHMDGIWDEHGYFPYNLNTSSFLALRKPLICWTSDEDPFGADAEEYFQRHLYMGAFLMVPYPANDHSATPSEEHERPYLDYGPLFNQLRGRTWLLHPGVITVKTGGAKANVFETPKHYVVFVGLAGKEQSAQIELRGIAGPARLLYPGETAEGTLLGVVQDAAVFEVPLKRGCAMLVFEKSAG